MLTIGLTGGISAGKSTVANFFAELAVPIIDADLIAKQLTQIQTPAYFEIVQHFGKNILSSNGNIDRKCLASLIFMHAPERKWLENLLHPLITQEIHKNLQTIKTPYCIVMIPLLVETGPHPFIDRILLIDTPEPLQIERLKERDKLDDEQIAAILASQTQREKRLAHADDIIHNNDDLTALRQQVQQWHEFYLNL